MSDEFEKAIRIEPFSGKQEDWQVWSEQFLARARRKGFKDILKGKVTVPTDDEMNASNLSADDLKKMKRIRELNDVAYEALLLLIDGKSRVEELRSRLCLEANPRRYQMGMQHWHGRD